MNPERDNMLQCGSAIMGPHVCKAGNYKTLCSPIYQYDITVASIS
jgi:hypothetical protein